MRLPFADQAVVPRLKITGYLLSDSHPEGKGKATFFRRFGFRRDQPQVLEAALRLLARDTDMTETIIIFGRKYVGTGTLTCPDGRQARITTVWVLRSGQPPPYFVTAYPG